MNPAVRASQRFFSSDHGAALNAWLAPLKATTEQILTDNRHGDYPRWLAALGDLPDIEASRIELDRDAIAVAGRSSAQSPQLRDALMRLCPWRKGPFNLFDCHIDSEWACNLKWQRLLPHLHPLSGRRVLDLGCGNGYYCLRLLGAGAASVVGFDPNLLFNLQFRAINRYANRAQAAVLPFGTDELASHCFAFDTVLSMGVLYHRREPLQHVKLLRDNLRCGGQLVLETLVLPAGYQWPRHPVSRYANMRNVWYLPELSTLQQLLRNSGFREVRIVSISHTSGREQRGTNWMTFHSLAEALDQRDDKRTIEGHPAPCRAIVTAIKP